MTVMLAADLLVEFNTAPMAFFGMHHTMLPTFINLETAYIYNVTPFTWLVVVLVSLIHVEYVYNEIVGNSGEGCILEI